MKKLLFPLIVMAILLLPNQSAKAYGECSQYGYLATYDYVSGMCKCMSGYVFGTDFLGNTTCVSADSVCKEQLGYNASYDYLSGGCKCSYGYVIQNNRCVSTSQYCRDKFGLWSSYNTLTDSCECDRGYTLGTDVLGQVSCVSVNSQCQEQYGYNAQSTLYGDKCECRSGYEFTRTGTGSTTCQSCSTKYGIHSTYNYISNKCECASDYTLNSENQCVEKQHNVYFTLKNSDADNKKLLIRSEYDSSNYVVKYGVGCYTNTANRNIGDRIVVNLGTDYDVDMFDKIVFPDDNEVCDILSVERVSSSYDFEREVISIPSTYTQIDIPAGIITDDSDWVTLEKSKTVQTNAQLVARLKGQILLQVEEHGEAWYVDPKTSKKYYLKDGPSALVALRKFGLGITNADLQKIPTEGSLTKGDVAMVNRMKGKILLQVQQNGEAWYVNPKDGKRYYLANGGEALRIMKILGVGIKNIDLRKIPVGDL